MKSLHFIEIKQEHFEEFETQTAQHLDAAGLDRFGVTIDFCVVCVEEFLWATGSSLTDLISPEMYKNYTAKQVERFCREWCNGTVSETYDNIYTRVHLTKCRIQEDRLAEELSRNEEFLQACKVRKGLAVETLIKRGVREEDARRAWRVANKRGDCANEDIDIAKALDVYFNTRDPDRRPSWVEAKRLAVTIKPAPSTDIALHGRTNR